MKEKKNTYTLVPPPINHKGRVFLLFILTLILSSCKYWHEPVREYLEKWTKEVSIEKFEVEDVESYYDKDGNLCIPSGQDATLTLFLINPFHYDYTGEYRDQMPQCTTPGMTIWPDANDTTLLHLTYDRDFLVAHDGKPDGGSEIGTTINYEHPVNTTPKSYTFSLKCNSKPPVINDAAIMYRTVSGQNYYVLAFNCPDPTLCSSTEIHRDIVAVNINGVSYSVQLDSSGNMSFFDSDIFARGMRDNLHVLNRDFNESERSVYFITTDPVINGVDKSFTISFVDSAGLDNLISLDTKVPSVAAPTVFNNDDNELVLDGMNILHTDSGKVYSTVRIEAPTRDAAGQPLENPSEPPLYISYELYEDSSISGNSILRGGGVGSKTMQIPEEGEYTLVVWAEKSGYLSSARSEYHLKLEYATLKAPVVKNVTNGASEVLLSTADNNYIELDSSGKITVHIFSPTETTAGESVSVNYDEANATKIHYVFNQGKTISEDVEFEEKKVSDFMESKQDFGQYCLTVYATKPGYNESAHVTYLIKAHNDTLYVAEGGNDTTNDGSPIHPYATIQHAVSELAAYNNSSKTYTINVSGQVNGLQTVSDDLNNKAAKLIITGVGDSDTLMGSGTGSVLSIMTSVQVEISSLGITGGNAGNSGKGGGLYANAGSNITLKTGAKIYGNSANRGGGLYIKSGATVTLAGATIGGSAQDKNTGIGNFSFGGGIYNEGTLNISSGTISYNTTTNDDSYGGGISNDGTLTISGGTISNNSVEGSGSKGAGVYNTGTFNMSGGTISSNTTGTNGRGAGVATEYSGNFVLSGGTISGNSGAKDGNGVYVFSSFTMSGSASVNSNNDVYLNGKVINISDDLSATSCATITPNVWARGIQVLGGNVTEANCGKFSLTDTFFEVVRKSATEGCIDAPVVYVSRSGMDDSQNFIGTSEKPFKTIKYAALGCWNPNREYVINIKDKLNEAQSVPSSTLISAKSITIQGTSSSDCEINANASDTELYSALTIAKTGMPILIKNLKITGGCNIRGGGINMSGNTIVKLEDDVIVAGNKTIYKKVNTGIGGGVWLGEDAKLFIYGSSSIGFTNSVVAAEDESTASNFAPQYGGGIYNNGSVYIGYFDYNESTNTGSIATTTGGVMKNYATYYGGGIYNKGKIYMASGKISYNGAGSNGGGLDNEGSFVMKGGSFTSNNSGADGGGIYFPYMGDKLEIHAGQMDGNTCAVDGGAIFAVKSFSLGTRKISGNASRQNDIFLSGSDTNSVSITLSAATLQGSSGTIYLTGPSLSWFYATTAPFYKALDGSIDRITANKACFKVAPYSGSNWTIDNNGYIKKVE